jgi:ADP-ribosylglycohydrolase
VIAQRFGVLDGFHPGPPDNEISAGQPAGQVTDDTDQALIVARLLIEGNGTVDPHRLVAELLDWEQHMRRRGSADLLGPSTQRALQAAASGVPVDQTGRRGDTNGAAMRVAPVGIAWPCEDLGRLVAAVHRASKVTHDTGSAISGAAAVAAAVSSGVAGGRLSASLALASSAADLGAQLGHYTAGASVAARIRLALRLARGDDRVTAVRALQDVIGVGVATSEAVPTAFGLVALAGDNLWDATRLAASLGGDCDTIAAMVGAIVGAHRGGADVPARISSELATANPDLDLDGVADELLAVRVAISAGPRTP